jgi:hypothetical protein
MMASTDNSYLQRAFLGWLEEAQVRLPMPIHIRRVTPEIIEFNLFSADSVLVGPLISRGDLVVAAEWQGECWDFLLPRKFGWSRRRMDFNVQYASKRGNIALFEPPEPYGVVTSSCHWKPGPRQTGSCRSRCAIPDARRWREMGAIDPAA